MGILLKNCKRVGWGQGWREGREWEMDGCTS